MLRTNDRESEIVLGNKQLLGIFFAVALLLGVAFYGGYMVGHSSSATKVSASPETSAAAPSPAKDNVSAGETHTIPGESGSSGDEGRSARDRESVIKSRPGSHELVGSGTADAPLGSSHKSKATNQTRTAAVPDSDGTGSYQPQAGAQYLQVVALGR